MWLSLLNVSLDKCMCCLTHEGPVTLGLGQGFGALLVGHLLQCVPVDVAVMAPSPGYSLWLGSLADRTLMYLRIVFIWQRDVSNILLMVSFSFSLAVISRLISSNLSPTTRIISPNTVSTATFTAFSITAPIWPRIREMVKFTSMPPKLEMTGRYSSIFERNVSYVFQIKAQAPSAIVRATTTTVRRSWNHFRFRGSVNPL